MQEFEIIMSRSGLYEMFESSWPKWEKAVLGYATGTKNKTQGLCSALKSLPSMSESDSDGEEEHTSKGKLMHIEIIMFDMGHLLCNSGTITALRCLAYFPCKKEKTKSTPREASDSHIPYVLREVPVSMHSIVC